LHDALPISVSVFSVRRTVLLVPSTMPLSDDRTFQGIRSWEPWGKVDSRNMMPIFWRIPMVPRYVVPDGAQVIGLVVGAAEPSICEPAQPYGTACHSANPPLTT